MRKSFDGLCGLISGSLRRTATSGEVFVFLNRRRTHMKLLHWEHGGFVLYYKRLEGGTFPLPNSSSPGGEIDWSELVLMVEGIVVEKSRRRHRFSLKKALRNYQKHRFLTCVTRWLFVSLCHADGTRTPIERGPFKGHFQP